MKKITKEFEVFGFCELSEEGQEKAINDAIDFFLECDFSYLSPEMKKAIKKAESMKTPWFTGSYIWEYAKEEIKDFCKEYNYLKDGTIFMMAE